MFDFTSCLSGMQPTIQPSQDELWRLLFETPSDFEDCRAAKAALSQPSNRPDFKHHETGLGLWLTGVVPAPNWVHDQLEGLYYGGVQVRLIRCSARRDDGGLECIGHLTIASEDKS